MFYSDLESGLRQKIDELEGAARQAVDLHWQQHLEANVNSKPEDKWRLNVWVRRRGDVLEATWTTFRFIRSSQNTSGNSKVLYTHIPKGRGNSYRYATLAGRASDSEIEVVWETEQKMAKIRGEYAEIRKALWYIKRAKKDTLTNESEAQASGEAKAPDSKANLEGEMA